MDKKVKGQRKIEEQRFEFVLYINNNIICQRFFNIYNFNEESVFSSDMDDMMKEICGMNNGKFGSLGIIPNHLKAQSMEYLWGGYNPYELQTEDSYQHPPKKGDFFQFEFKVDKNVVASAEFSNEFFTLSNKVSVDIRNVIPEIMNEIRTTTSKKTYDISTETNEWLESQKDFMIKL